jgi:hypothetical protein
MSLSIIYMPNMFPNMHPIHAAFHGQKNKTTRRTSMHPRYSGNCTFLHDLHKEDELIHVLARGHEPLEHELPEHLEGVTVVPAHDLHPRRGLLSSLPYI